MAEPKKKAPNPPAPSKPRHYLWLGLLGLLTLIALGGSLFTTQQVLSDRSADIASQFLYARAFGFGELAKGNLPLWNPYIYSGVPFLGDFQSALLYPPNLIFLLLPLAAAMNWSIALHVFGLGAAMYGWTFWRGFRPVAAFVSGACAMFGGTFFLHIYAGHLSNVCTMAWVPLIFWGIDGWLARRHAGWLFLAAAAAALQLYAGHVQYFYYTALIAGLYSLVYVIGTTRPVIALAGLAAIYPMAALLSAAQLLPGLSAAGESVRSGGVNYEFAAMFSLPPENFLTLLAPWAFGDMRTVPYWGRCYLWEMSLFAGVGMLLLAVFGLLHPMEKRGRTRLLVLLGLIALLALGTHTPLHRLLYNILPGFSSFRGASKFIFFFSILLAFCAGAGVNALWDGKKSPVLLGIVAIVLGGITAAFGLFLNAAGGQKIIHQAAMGIVATKESYLNPAAFEQEAFMKAAQAMGSHALLIAGGCLILFAILLFLNQRWKPARVILVAGAVLEVFLFARGTVVTFPIADFFFPGVQDFYTKNPGDYRTLNLFNPDASMVLRNGNIWGYDPSVLKRYAQLLTLSQGIDPAQASQYLPFQQPHPILSLVRGKIVMVAKPNGEIEVTPLDEPLPHFAVFSQYKVISNQEERFGILRAPQFDFTKTVILEQEPIPRPEGLPAKLEIREIESSTDSLSLEVLIDRASLLMITDSFSKDWTVESLPGSTQITYELLPANHALRVIPLAAGRHVLRLSYVPAGLGLGMLISLLTSAGVILALSLRRLRHFLNFSA